MAEIPVEKKSGGIPWWVWLILALLIAALIWWFVANANDRDGDVADTDVVAEQPMDDSRMVDTTPTDANGSMTASGDTITSMATLTGAGAGAMSGMVGRQVSLQGVPVESLEGDMAFYIGDSPANRTLVVFDETPDVPKEKRTVVKAGSRVTFDGMVRAAGDVPADVKVTMPQGTDAYVYANKVDVVS
ncbi:hypothetical protein [Novosphingopyxis sp.]|uniref:hypothetical protein n=1 Tax=Novosphingopyxis sp. TaxID=2709690 RepID=UPI003B59E8D2